MIISSCFDGGNIEVLTIDPSGRADLAIRTDTNSDHFQWFYFKVTADVGATIVLRLTGLNKSSYANAWDGYTAVVSADAENWLRAPTTYESGVMTITLDMVAPQMSVAYFAPYSLDRNSAAVSKALASGRFAYDILGQSVDGRDIERLRFGSHAVAKGDAGKGVARPPVWIIARQHPGESMASWWMEGALEMLSDPEDPVANGLRDAVDLHIVPLMNPDGAYRGHLRTNTPGADLNREWAEPSPERSPEVLCVRNEMDKTGVALFLDIHGDEELPYNFIEGFEGVASASDAMLEGLNAFRDRLCALSPDFQKQYGYPVAKPGGANLNVASQQVAERYRAISMTMEMPFKDNAVRPIPEVGWSPERAKHLARASLQAILMQRY
ncbi:MAG: M14-type cytosolic carboxypeptidase [Pseudomonadota bacterium]